MNRVPTADEHARRHVKMTELITIRIYGDNITMFRSAWMEMLDDMKPDCDNYKRIEARLT